MKAYAVVRKPEPSNKTLQHTIRLQKKNPQISIDPIKDNTSITPRKAEQNLSNHLLQTKTMHFKIEEELVSAFRFSRTSPRKHPIFSQMTSEFLQQKNLLQKNQKIQSRKMQENSQYSHHSSRIQKTDYKINAKLNSQNRQIYTTPQKARFDQQKITPYEMLNRSSRERQGRSLVSPHRYKIFEQYRNTSKQKRLNSYERSQKNDKTVERNLAPQLQFVQHRSLQLTNGQQLNHREFGELQTFRGHQPKKYDRIRESELSGSEIDLGCCGEQLKQKNKRGLNQSQRQSVGSVYRQNTNKAIINSIGLQFLARNNERSTEKYRRKIFKQHNTELQKSNERETVNYKQEKIKSKPIVQQVRPKSRKVIVFEINNYSPFEF